MTSEGEKFEEPPTSPEESKEENEIIKEEAEEVIKHEELAEREIEGKTEKVPGGVEETGVETKEKNETEKIEECIKEVSLEMKENGFPVEDNRRINMDAFKEKYPPWKIEQDKRGLEEKKKDWEKEKVLAESDERAGEKLEMFTTAIFDKFLGKDYFILRASEYDDAKHGVDNIIIEKETGNTVCAFDEVADETGPVFERKKAKILRENLEGGTTLEYGVSVRKIGEKTKILLTSERNLPIFYVPFSARHVEEGIKEFKPSLKEKSEYEERAFNYFLSTIKQQIDALQLDRSKLNFVLRGRLDVFEEKLKELKLIEEKNRDLKQKHPKRRAIGMGA